MIAEMQVHRLRGAAEVRLQWGRDQMIAEMTGYHALVCGVDALQWGRDQMIAEIMPGSAYFSSSRFASMGPRSDDRGNKESDAGTVANAVLLQWGRDQMIAEIGMMAA